MIHYALDTSILLRWFSPAHDADAERALRLRDEHLAQAVELMVLDQAIYELIHVLKESHHFDPPRLDKALASLEYLHLTIVPYSPEIIRKATQIACEHDISIYAAGYIALGAQQRCQAVTCDRDLYRKVAGLPWTALLAHLGM